MIRAQGPSPTLVVHVYVMLCLPEVIAVTEFKPKNLVHSLRLSEIQLDGYNVLWAR